MARWREVGIWREDPDLLEMVLSPFLSFLGVGESYWVCVYRDEESGREVRGTGSTPEEARRNALSRI